MKLKIENLFTFVKNNPQHFSDLNEELGVLLSKTSSNSCAPCSKNSANNAIFLKDFQNLLNNEEIRILILDKSKDLLDDVVELEDFSVNTYSENYQNK